MPTLEAIETPDLFGPHAGAQEQFLNDYSNRYCAFAGGWGAGKSWAGSRKLANLHFHNAMDAQGKLTGVDSLIVAPTYQLAEVVNLPQMRAAFDEMGLPHRFISNPKIYAFELPSLSLKHDPSYIYVRSADIANLIAGFEVGAVWGDEVARWPYAREGEDPVGDPMLQADARLRDARARVKQFNFTYTNEGEDTRVYRDFEESPKPGHKLYRGSTRENVSLPPDYVVAQLEQLSPDLATQYVDGYAAKLSSNIIYSNFDVTRNASDATLDLEPGLPIQMGVDFNKNPGMHAVIGQHFKDKELLTAIACLHRRGMLIKQMMHEFDTRWGERIRAGEFPKVELFGDPSGNTGSMSDGETYWDVIRAELRARDIPYSMMVAHSHPLIADRANSVNSAFCSASGKIKYLIHPRCDVLIRDYRHMKWDGNKMDKRQKEMSHASDADGYRVHRLMPILRHIGQPAQSAVLNYVE